MRVNVFLPALLCVIWFAPGLSVHVTASNAKQQPVVRPAAAGDPLQQFDEIVFAVRLPYNDPHWYANIGYYCEDQQHKAYAGNGNPGVGKLCKLNVRTGKVAVLLDAKGGSVRDPQVDYDGHKVLFSYRKAGTDYYHLYEIGIDGTGPRQITSGVFDDYEPCYLPDGDIIFVSTRCRSWVNCWKTQVGVLYRCHADGRDMRRLSYSGEHDNTPWVLPDGRILYTRWEYVDRSQVEFHHLWVMNADGTSQEILFGNMHPGTVMIDAKPIPGSDKIMASFSPGHGVTDHKGIATILSLDKGPDDPTAARRLHNWPLIEDPYPLSENCFLVARGKKLQIMDGRGKTKTLYTWNGPGDLREPRPVMARPREPIVASRVDWSKTTGRIMLADVYKGRHMQGVARGDIKKLLLLEVLPKPVNFSGGPDLVSWLGTFTLERVLGTVPVEADGSAYFEVPACRPVFFVALDQNDLSVQRMHSFTTVMPGENAGCVGCHEPRNQTPFPMHVQALNRPPSQIRPFEDFPDVLDFTRDIQPILDQHCVRCHNYHQRDGQVILAGDLGPEWSHSYFSLLAHLQVADGRNGLGNYPPRTIGSSASPLLDKLKPGHHGVQVTPRQWRTVWLWIESGAPFAGSYGGLRNAKDETREYEVIARVLHLGADVLQRRCGKCHVLNNPRSEKGLPIPFNPITARNRRGLTRPTGVYERVVLENDPIARLSVHILLNFTHPDLSPLLLGPLAKEAGGWGSCGAIFADTDGPDYQRLLAGIRKGKEMLDTKPRWGTPGFQPNWQYVREMQRFGILPANVDPSGEKIDVFQTDAAYWRSLWHHLE